ncbi:MAG: SDR family oxidoreductase [Cyclobacteriaceae bacterium]|jgi:uncharacterized protein YbjT (DUF2867 family)|nr:SDR family oxidoreductase [Cyclobacteriaceae bacterium]
MEKKILVTGATGTIGKALIKALTEQKANFVAATRDVNKLPQKVNAIAFDFEDASSFAKATADVDRVFLLAPPLNTKADDLLIPFIEHLEQEKIKRVVYVSALEIDALPSMPFHANTIKLMQSKGFELTVLQPSFFAQNFKNYEFENITKHNIIYAVAGEGKVGFVDAEDIGRVAATALTTHGHSGKFYEITGPELLSYFDAANVISEVIGKTIVYPNPTAEQFTQTLAQAGAPAFIADYMIDVYSLIANNRVNKVTSVVENVTGRKPTSLKEVIKRDFSK